MTPTLRTNPLLHKKILRTSVNEYMVNGYGIFRVLNKKLQTNKPSKVGPYPSDLHEIGCKTNGKTRPLVPVTAARPETAKYI
jgi:hypothetical protein